MTLLFAVEETNIHMRWDLQNQIWRKEKVTVSFEIEDFALNIKTTSVLMELLQQVGVGNVSFNLNTSSFLIFLLHIPYTIYFDEPYSFSHQPLISWLHMTILEFVCH